MEYKREIKSWTISFSVLIVKLTKELATKGIPSSIINQVLRSGTSVGANVHEGKSSTSERELIRYLSISLKSANETEYWLKIIIEAYNFESETIKECGKELTELQKVIASIIIKLKSKQQTIKK